MSQQARIHFSFNGKSYIYAGEFPDEVGDEVMDAQTLLLERYSREGYPQSTEGDMLPFTRAIIEEMGGEVTRVEGARKDGVVHWQDLPDLKIY